MAELQAYDSLEPFGNIEPTWMTASFAAIFLNSIRSIFAKKGETPKLIPVEDFIPQWGRKMIEKEQTTAEQKAFLQMLVNSLGKEPAGKKKPLTKKRKVRK